MSMNKYGGVNDMPDGFTKTKLGKRIYSLWFGMLRRCYDAEQHKTKRGKSYKNVIVCDRWFYLKSFYEDIQKIEGYSKWADGKESMSLDKDLMAQEVSKIYSPRTCKFVTSAENMQEMNERCNTVVTAREYRKTIYVLFKEDEYHVFESEKDACDFLKVRKSSVSSSWKKGCKCKGYNIIRIGSKTEMEVEK